MSASLKRKAADAASSSTKKPKANATITSFFSSPSSASTKTGAAAPSDNAAPSSSPTTAKEGDTSTQSSQAAATTKPTTKTTSVTAPIFNTGSTSTAPEPPAKKFDKAQWVEKLTPEQKDLLALEIESLDESWLAQLKDEVLSKDFLELKRFLKREHESGAKIFPPAPDVYSWYVELHLSPLSREETMDFSAS